MCDECYNKPFTNGTLLERDDVSIRNEVSEGDHADEGSSSYEEESFEMNLVHHRCSTYLDQETGLPVRNLTVMCGETGWLHSFL